MTEEKPKKPSRIDILDDRHPLQEGYNPKGITTARGKQPPSESKDQND